MNVVKLSLNKVKYALSKDFESRKGVSSGALNGNEVCTPCRHQLSTLKKLTKCTSPCRGIEALTIDQKMKWRLSRVLTAKQIPASLELRNMRKYKFSRSERPLVENIRVEVRLMLLDDSE